MEFVPANSIYKVWADRDDDDAEYGLFGSDDMEDMESGLEDVKKPWRHERVLCSALQFSLCYKWLSSKEKKERACTRKDDEVGKSESREKESVEQQPAIEIETSALHCTHVVGSYEQETAARPGEHSL